MTEFKIGDQGFRFTRLKLQPSLKALTLLAESLIPAVVAAAHLDTADVTKALAGFKSLPELVDLFVMSCKFERQPDEWVDLKPFVDSVFDGKTAMLLAWLSACVEQQFTDFFDGSGLPLLEAAASRFTSLLGSTGGSGAS